ncbi:MAG: FHA domain-containing protein, partial [Pseudomonadota bacterium]
QTLLHIELSLQAATVSHLHQTAGLSTLADVRSLEGSGLTALNELWLKFFAQQFVQQCRFDPLHSAETEQIMSDALHGWLDLVERSETSALTMTHGGMTHEISVSRVDVINAVADHYQRISDMARAALAGGRSPALQLTRSAANLPGFAAFLAARVGGQFFVIEDDAAARQVEALPQALDSGPSRVQKSFQLTGQVANVPTGVAELAAANAPTHIVHDATVIGLSGQSLLIGAQAAPDRPRMLVLEGQPAGVSGLHCEIRVDGSQVVVNDMSRFGTFLNGNRVSGNAVLAAGDLLRVGTPGVEFQLVREVVPE